MVHYRQALVRMRQGESDRQIHATGLMGRRNLGSLRNQAKQRGWLDADCALPPDAELAAVLQPQKPAHAGVRSSLEPYRTLIEKWSGEGVDGTTIHAALKRRNGYSGSYSSVRRFVRSVLAKTPRLTTVLEFSPGDAAQVDFGKGPEIIDVHTGEVFKTWVFVMVLAWSRHQYAELVRDQSRSEEHTSELQSH